MAKKRVNGEGTIGKRKDGRWEARYIAGRDPETGKQIRKSILGKTQAEVRAKLKEALAEATEIDVVKSGEYNVADWMQAWYALYAQPNVRETTARYYMGYIDHHVIPRLGEIPLNKLTSLEIQQFYKDLLENGRIREDTKVKKPGLSSTTVHGIHVMLKSALKRAVQERLIPFNPAEFCIPPKITKPELQVIPSERYQSYLHAAEQRGVLPMFYLELSTGLRKGEIAALLWSDYDAQTQTIHVTKQYLSAGCSRKLPEPSETLCLRCSSAEKRGKRIPAARNKAAGILVILSFCPTRHVSSHRRWRQGWRQCHCVEDSRPDSRDPDVWTPTGKSRENPRQPAQKNAA